MIFTILKDINKIFLIIFTILGDEHKSRCSKPVIIRSKVQWLDRQRASLGFTASDGTSVPEPKPAMGSILDPEASILEPEVNLSNEGNGDNSFFFIEHEIIYRLKTIMI